jgi:hypothetical protein
LNVRDFAMRQSQAANQKIGIEAAGGVPAPVTDH